MCYVHGQNYSLKSTMTPRDKRLNSQVCLLANSKMAFRSDVVEKLIECPVCYEILNGPKSLSCGHAICKTCADTLTCGKREIECPVCREKTYIPLGGLATTYAFSQLLNHITSERDSRCHKCTTCDKLKNADDICICYTCNKMSICLSCAFKQHKDHTMQQLSDVIEQQRKKFDKWKDTKGNQGIEKMEKKSNIIAQKRLQSERLCTNLGKMLKNETVSWLNNKETELQTQVKLFREKLNQYSEMKEKDMNQENGYTIDTKSLEEQLANITDAQNKFVQAEQDLTTITESLQTKLTELGVTGTDRTDVNPFPSPMAMPGRVYMGQPRVRIRRSHGTRPPPQPNSPVRQHCNREVPNLIFQRVVMAPPILLPTDSSETSDESS